MSGIDFGARKRPARTVALGCGHTNAFPDPAPKPGAYAYCRECRDWCRATRPTKES